MRAHSLQWLLFACAWPAAAQVVSTSWDDWKVEDDPGANAPVHVKSRAVDRNWRVLDSADGNGDRAVRATPIPVPADKLPIECNSVSLRHEGHYFQTRRDWTRFRLTIKYRALRSCVTPKGKEGNHSNQDYGNSGIYIFDRYEVQIIDPGQFDREKGADPCPKDVPLKNGVPTGARIRDDCRARPPDGSRNMLVPGSMYGVNIKRWDLGMEPNRDEYYVNRARPTAERWNVLVVDFCPGTLEKGVLTAPARVQTRLNDNIVFSGDLRSGSENLKGTGGTRSKLDPLVQGPVFLQSHWGSPVEFFEPRVEEIREADCPQPPR